MTASSSMTSRKIDGIGLGAAVLLTAVAYVAGVQPALDRQAELQARSEERDAKRAAAQEAELALGQVRKQVAAAEQAVAEHPLRLQPVDALNARLADLTAAAGRHGLMIEQVEPGRPTASQHYVTVPIRIAGRSSYGGSARFLHELRAAMPDVAVAAIDLQGEPRSASGEAKFTFALLWHAAPERMSSGG